MAEQNNDDTKSAAARRGARPFAGPVAASTAARPPLLRPPAPANRPERGPFAPPPSAGRRTSGTPHTGTPIGAPAATPTPAAVALTISQPAEAAAPPTALIPELTPESVDEPARALDVASLGSGIDAQELWGEEIIAAPESLIDAPPRARWTDVNVSGELDFPETGAEWPREPASVLPPVIEEEAAPISSHVEEATTMPSWVSEEHETSSPVGEAGMDVDVGWADEPDTSQDTWPDPLRAEYAPYVAPPETVEVVPDAAPQAATDSTHELRVSAALVRLAERIRSGEIDVSSVAPEATEAAVLASVLAALLGGSSTR